MSAMRVDAKVVMLGKESVGKTSLVERYVHHRFLVGPYQNTIGAAFVAKPIQVADRVITLGIWDTAGSERYEAMSRIYYRGARAAVVCYDELFQKVAEDFSSSAFQLLAGEFPQENQLIVSHPAGSNFKTLTVQLQSAAIPHAHKSAGLKHGLLPEWIIITTGAAPLSCPTVLNLRNKPFISGTKLVEHVGLLKKNVFMMFHNTLCRVVTKKTIFIKATLEFLQ
uniref:RAB24, member RAS onco family n=1 Tax=Poecilia reticulata TaxID=8081 RepID=A0A3P9NGN3_POERE